MRKIGFELMTAVFSLLLLLIKFETLFIQVSLAIRGGYIPGKSSTANTKTAILS